MENLDYKRVGGPAQSDFEIDPIWPPGRPRISPTHVPDPVLGGIRVSGSSADRTYVLARGKAVPRNR